MEAARFPRTYIIDARLFGTTRFDVGLNDIFDVNKVTHYLVTAFKESRGFACEYLVHQILAGKAPRLFEGSDQIVRDFVYIKDVIQANIKACSAKKSGVYNVGTGKPRSFQDIADILQKELGTDYGTEYFPNPFTGYQMHTQAEVATSKEYLDYAPEWELEEGIKDYIDEIKRMYDEEVKGC